MLLNNTFEYYSWMILLILLNNTFNCTVMQWLLLSYRWRNSDSRARSCRCWWDSTFFPNSSENNPRYNLQLSQPTAIIHSYFNSPMVSCLFTFRIMAYYSTLKGLSGSGVNYTDRSSVGIGSRNYVSKLFCLLLQ